MRLNAVVISALLVSAVPMVAAADSRPMESAGGAVDDTWINTKVQEQFVTDGLVHNDHIKVKTKHGVVSLSGKVQSDEARDRALSITRNTKGVEGVIDDMTVAH